MKRYTIYLCLISALLFATGCTSSKKVLQRGDYYKSAMMAVEQLRSSPNNKRAQEVLLQAYPLAKSNSLRIIQKSLASSTQNRYSVAADEYIALENLTEAIYHCPKALELIPGPEEFGRQLNEILPLAAEEAYSLGVNQFRLGTIESARDAYNNFVKADEYAEGYRDVKNKIEESLYAATFKVIVEKPVTPKTYQLTADFFYDNLMAKISQLSKNRFLRFYTYEEARNEGLTTPDHYLILDFQEFTTGNMAESKNTIEVKRDSVLVGTTTVNGKEHDVYGTVKASFTTNRREVVSEGILSAQIIEAVNNRILQNRNFPGKFVWINEWAGYKGDERALDEKQKKMAATEPAMPPPRQTLFVEFTKPIFDQTVSFVNSYYRKY